MSPNSDERIVYFCFLLILKIIKTNLKDYRRDDEYKDETRALRVRMISILVF